MDDFRSVLVEGNYENREMESFVTAARLPTSEIVEPHFFPIPQQDVLASKHFVLQVLVEILKPIREGSL
jgi:hypothetical protein